MTAARLLRGPIGWAIGLILLIFALASVFTTVPETQQAVIVRMGMPRAVINLYRPDQPFGRTGAGLIARVPLVDQVFYVDKRVQTLDIDGQPLLSADGRRIEADGFAHYRVLDPARFYLATRGNAHAFPDAMKPVLGASLRENLGRLPASALLAPGPLPAMHTVMARLDEAARSYGARVTEVRLDRIGLAEGAPLDEAIGRMRDAREQQAADIRDAGYREAMRIRTDGDAQASRIYADAFGQDPDFYDFYRAMQSYRITFGDGATQMVLSPNSEYFHQFRSGGKQ